MTTKEQMLGRVRSALADREQDRDGVVPPIPEVWKNTGLSTDEMADRFAAALEAVQGEMVLCRDFDEAVEKIFALFREIGIDETKKVAVTDRPLSRQVAEKLDGPQFMLAPENTADASPEELSKADAGIVSPEYLLADTGSCVFHAPVAFDRLATYIVPISVVVADRSMLRENLPAVWSEIRPRLTEGRSGEYVIVTGPSRTADIEKILILGVHGPKRVIVFLIEAE